MPAKIKKNFKLAPKNTTVCDGFEIGGQLIPDAGSSDGEGALTVLLMARWTRRHNLNSILCLIGSQCRALSAGVTWSFKVVDDSGSGVHDPLEWCKC